MKKTRSKKSRDTVPLNISLTVKSQGNLLVEAQAFFPVVYWSTPSPVGQCRQLNTPHIPASHRVERLERGKDGGGESTLQRQQEKLGLFL